MKKYRDKSDFEINKAVAVSLGYTAEYENESVTVFRNNNGGMPLVVSATADSPDNFDPCNNPSDAMPIVIDNRIMLNPYCADDLWKCEAKVGKDDIFDIYAVCYDKNPYRAAMEVFLMMKGAE